MLEPMGMIEVILSVEPADREIQNTKFFSFLFIISSDLSYFVLSVFIVKHKSGAVHAHYFTILFKVVVE